MKVAENIWKRPNETFEFLLKRGIKWRQTIPLFGFNGIILAYYYMKSQNVFDLDSDVKTLASILALLIVGFIYGIYSNLLIGLLIKITGKLFGAKNNIKDIYNVMSWAYLPYLFSTMIVISNIWIVSNVLAMENVGIQVTLSIIVILFYLLMSILGIWSLILLFRGLKLAQGTDSTNTILNYVLAGLIFGVINYPLLHM